MKLIRQAQKATPGVERNPRSVETLVFIQVAFIDFDLRCFLVAEGDGA
jgi:hypothetical protein